MRVARCEDAVVDQLAVVECRDYCSQAALQHRSVHCSAVFCNHGGSGAGLERPQDGCNAGARHGVAATILTIQLVITFLQINLN